MSPHDTPDSDPAFRALRSRVDRLERAREQRRDRLDRLERLVAALAAETDRQRAVIESVLDEEDPRLARDATVEKLLDAIAEEEVNDVDRP